MRAPLLPLRSVVSLAIALFAIAASVFPSAQEPASGLKQAGDGDVEYDIVIRGGRVLDGMGNPWILADVAIRDGRFVRIGRVEGRGRQEINATGRYVSPGWIDMLDQSGVQLAISPAATKLQMGVTTAIGGEGGTPVPAERIAGYFAALEKSGIALNFGTYYSEAQARDAVIGSTARVPDADELRRMRVLLETAMRAGAMGMTTALIYPPGTFAATDELVEMAKVAARYGGIYASHIRDEGKDLIAAIEEAIAIGERAGLPVEIFHLKVAYQPGWGSLMRKAGETIDAARARGVDVAADMYVYTASSTGLEATIPTWAQEGGRSELVKRLQDPAIRTRLKREMATGLPGWENLLEAAGGWDRVVLADARNPENARFTGKSIADIGRDWGKDPADAAFDLVAQGNGRVMAIYHNMSEPDVEMALRFPWTSIGSDGDSDLAPAGLTHPRTYGNFPRVIARYVRERGVLTLEDAIRKMTSWPATRMRLADRGAIRQGLWADVVIFDLDTLQDLATFEEPRRSSAGIDYVLVNGQVVIDHGRHTGARPGHVLYGPGRAQTSDDMDTAVPACLPGRVAVAPDVQPMFTGRWKAELPAAREQYASFDLRADGTRVTGTVDLRFAEVPLASAEIYDGTVDGTTITFKAKSPDGDRIITFRGTSHTEEIAFTREVEVGPGGRPGGAGIFGVGGPPTFTACPIMPDSRRPN